MSQKNSVQVTIMDKNYRVACTPEREELLRASVAEVNEQIQTLQQNSQFQNKERVAVMVAVNMASQWLESQEEGFTDAAEDVDVVTAPKPSTNQAENTATSTDSEPEASRLSTASAPNVNIELLLSRLARMEERISTTLAKCTT